MGLGGMMIGSVLGVWAQDGGVTFVIQPGSSLLKAKCLRQSASNQQGLIA
jgi:hypothetical protein